MNSYEYWQGRMQRAAARAYNGQEKKTQIFMRAYKQAADEIAKETAALHSKLMRNGKLSLSELYKYDRFKNYSKQITVICDALAKNELDFATGAYSALYQQAFSEVGKGLGLDFTAIPKSTVNAALKHPWSGENYSARIWANRAALVRNVKSTVVVGTIKGQSVSGMTNALRQRVESSAYNARRLIRTEAMHFINQGQIDGYRQLGVTMVDILVAEDERTCDVCMANEGGNPYSIDEAELMLPTHPQCRCTYTARLDSIDRSKAAKIEYAEIVEGKL